ncbi:MAG: Ig-like domain-containing protein, partial [Chloroflexota bacterium]|nr:Ig-like domain-containing protein [Chloroflexota bacterium]
MANTFLRLTPMFVCLVVVFLTTCGKDSPTSPKPPEPPPPVTLVPTRIEITPASPRLNSIGQTVQLNARVFDQNNTPMNNTPVAWSSSNLGVATVSAQGLVTAVGNGVVRITATSGSVSSGIDVTVMQSAGSIAIEPGEVTLMSIGATVQLTATVLDENGQPVAGAVVIWQSSDASVATVSAEGLVTAVGNGVVRITATSGS